MKTILRFSTLVLLLTLETSPALSQNRLYGDVNGDGEVNISDVNAVIDVILGGTEPNPPGVEAYTVNGVKFRMVKVEGGTFAMGRPDGGDYNGPAHQVTLPSYYIGETEVTQALWQAVMGSNPSSFTDRPNCPVENVTWNDCQEFITRLNELTGKAFRLPTEAEWEFAARGGNKSQGYIYAGSKDLFEVAWYMYSIPTQSSGPQPCARKAPNELGIYDMSGNVEEWCQDWFDGNYYLNSPTYNPTGPDSGSSRVIRGGSWNLSNWYCYVWWRHMWEPIYKFDYVGLRVGL